MDSDSQGRKPLLEKAKRSGIPAHRGWHGERQLLRKQPLLVVPITRIWSRLRTTKGEDRKIYEVRSSPRDQLQPELITLKYAKPGDKLPVSKPHLFDLKTKNEIPVSDKLFPNPWSITRMRWDADGKAFTFLYNQRGHQALRLLEVNAETGKVRPIINEESKTFIDYAGKHFLHEVPGARRIHLDVRARRLESPVSIRSQDRQGEEPDHEGALGRPLRRSRGRPEPDKSGSKPAASIPNKIPTTSISAASTIDGTGLVRLTEGDGNHSIRYSPDQKFLHRHLFARGHGRRSRSCDDRKMEAGLRTGTGGHVGPGEVRLEGARALRRQGPRWQDRHLRVIFRPTNFDPSKKYPVIEQIYAGPQGSFVPKAFRAFYYPQEMAELGFIIVQIDGMGTSNRSKAFHDVCCKNLADAGFPDRILWMKAAAKKYPYMDLSRVGVYGGSAGGQNALRRPAVPRRLLQGRRGDCGCHDNRMDKVWWNELWMGYPDRAALRGTIECHERSQADRQAAANRWRSGFERRSRIDHASRQRADQSEQGFRADRLPQRQPRGRAAVPMAPAAEGLLRQEPARRRAAQSQCAQDRDRRIRLLNRRKTFPHPKKAIDPKPAEKAKPIPPPDLVPLVAKSRSEVRSLARRFEADRGSLMRKYAIPTAPTTMPDFANSTTTG